MPKKKKSKFWAATLSLIFPGAGQFYNGSWIKGFIILGLIGISFYLMVIPFIPIIESFGSFDAMVDQVLTSLITGVMPKLPNIDISFHRIVTFFALGTGIFFAVYLYSIIDAIAVAGNIAKKSLEEKFEKEVIEEFLTKKVK